MYKLNKMNPNIQTEPTPEKKRAKSANLEGKIQASIVSWFGQKYPNERGRLFAYFANPESKIQGGVMLAHGLVKDISDLLYITTQHNLISMEIKSIGTYHDVKHLCSQAHWLMKFPVCGRFVDSLEGAQDLIEGRGDDRCVHPNKVLENLKNIKTKTILWDLAKK